MLKFYLKIPLLVALLSPFAAARADQGVVVLLRDGSTVGFTFEEKPVLVTGTELEIQTDSSGTVSYPYENIKKVSFDEVASAVTAITTPRSRQSRNEVSFRMLGNSIEVSGLAKGQRADVYDESGT